MKIGVCEKMADCYRIGNVCNGIDWKEANIIVLRTIRSANTNVGNVLL